MLSEKGGIGQTAQGLRPEKGRNLHNEYHKMPSSSGISVRLRAEVEIQYLIEMEKRNGRTAMCKKEKRNSVIYGIFCYNNKMILQSLNIWLK